MSSVHFMTSAKDHFARFCYGIENGGLSTAVLAAHAGNAEFKAISGGLIRNCHILEIRMAVVLFGCVLDPLNFQRYTPPCGPSLLPTG